MTLKKWYKYVASRRSTLIKKFKFNNYLVVFFKFYSYFVAFLIFVYLLFILYFENKINIVKLLQNSFLFRIINLLIIILISNFFIYPLTGQVYYIIFFIIILLTF